MNKEELLKHLTELQTRLDSEVDNYDIDGRVQEIEDINGKIDDNNKLIEEYRKDLSDDKNFLDKTPLQYYLMVEVQELENLKAKQAAERENADKILSEDAIIANSEATILAGEEEIEKLANDDVQLNVNIRRARLTSNQDKIAACEAQIASNANRTKEIEETNAKIKTAIEEHKSVIESLEGLTDKLKEQTTEAEQKYNEAVENTKANHTERVDLAKKNKAEDELDSLLTLNDTLEQRSTAISYDFSGELKDIISDYQTSAITDEEVKARLKELKERLPEDFVKTDEATRIAKIAENQKAQEVVEAKVLELTRRISNEDNYRVTPAAMAKIRAKLSTCQKNIGSFNSQIALLETQMPTSDVDLAEYKQMIDICNNENEDILRQLILNNGVDKELENELISKQKANFNIIAEANELINGINNDKEENEQVLAQLKERKARTEKLLASYNEQLSDENALDRSKLRLDQIELAKNQQGLNALKNREKYINNTIVSYIDSIIDNNLDLSDVAINNENSPLPFPTEDGINEQDLDSLNKDNQDMEPIPVGTVNPENDFSDLNPDGMGLSDEDLKLLNVEPTAPEAGKEDAEEENGKIEEVSTKDADEKLVEKAKSGSFRSALKKYWKRVLIVVTILVTIVGLKSCESPNVKKATDAVTKDPAVMDSIINSKDPDDSLKDFFDRNNINLDGDTTKTNSDTGKTNGTGTGTGTNASNTGNSSKGKSDDSGKSNSNGNTSSAAPSTTNDTTTEKAADPVDPSTIKDEHPDTTTTQHADPVDPSTIKDEHPDTNSTIPPETPDQGTKTETSGVTGDETVPDNAWNNETPSNSNNSNSNSNSSSTTGTTQSGVSGNETVPDNAWDNETPVIDNSVNSNNTSSTNNVTATPSTSTSSATTSTTTTSTSSAATDDSKTVTIAVKEGDALIMDSGSTTYVADNNSNYQAKDSDQPEIASPDVQSVSVSTEKDGSNTVNVEVNSSAAVRDTALTDSDVDTISKENNIDQDEVAKIEAQYKAQQAALEEIKQQVQSAQTTTDQAVTENTASISR